jgi:hypothetical protein
LPLTVRVFDGLTVEGASPGLLSELLEAYSFELKARDRMTYDALLPGLQPEEIARNSPRSVSTHPRS